PCPSSHLCRRGDAPRGVSTPRCQGEAESSSPRYSRNPSSMDLSSAAETRPRNRVIRLLSTERSWSMRAKEGFVRPLAPGASRGLERSFPRRTRDRHDAHQRIALLNDHLGRAHDYAGAYPLLFVAHRRIEGEHGDDSPLGLHSSAPTHPWSAVHRTSSPAPGATRSEASSENASAHVAKPTSAISRLSG